MSKKSRPYLASDRRRKTARRRLVMRRAQANAIAFRVDAIASFMVRNMLDFAAISAGAGFISRPVIVDKGDSGK